MNGCVSDLLEKKKIHILIWVDPNDTVLAALNKMAEFNTGSVAVMNNGVLEGILSERDCVRKLEVQGRSASTTPVSEIMTPRSELRTVWVESSLAECWKIMIDDDIRHLPVLEGEGEYERVRGMVSLKDVSREIGEVFGIRSGH